MPIRELPKEEWIASPKIRELPKEEWIPTSTVDKLLKEIGANAPITDAAKRWEEQQRNAASGFARGINDVGLTAQRAIRAADQAVPALQAIDTAVLGLTPEKQQENIEKNKSSANEYESSDYGKSFTGRVARVIGQNLVTLPIGIGAASALRAGANAVSPAAGAIANWATGGGRGLISGPLSNALAGSEVQALNNALTGQPITQNVPQAAMMGAAAYAVPATTGALYNAVKNRWFANPEQLANQTLTQASGVTPQPMNNPLLLQESPIPGVQRTLPEAIQGGNPGVSAVYRSLENTPEYGPLLARRAQENAAARQDVYERMMPFPTRQDIADAIEARAQQEGAAIGDVFKPGQSTNSFPVIQKIDDILSKSSSRKDPVVQSVLKNIKNTLIEAQPSTGLVQLVDDPAVLYNSTRKPIDRILQNRLGPNAEAIDKTVAGHLQSVKSELDKAIEQGAPGFKQALSDFSETSKPINQSQFLQTARTNTEGNVTLQGLNKLIDKAEQMRLGSGANSAKALTDEQMQTLYALRDDMLRSNQINLGKARGSNTIQNAQAAVQLTPGTSLANRLTNPELLSSALGTAGYWLGGGPITGFLGNLAGSHVANTLATNALMRNQAYREALANYILEPNTYFPQALPKPVVNELFSVTGGAATPLVVPNNRQPALTP